MNALKNLVAAETALVQQITAATDVVNGIGTSRVEQALDGFAAALIRAETRLKQDLFSFAALADSLTDVYRDNAEVIAADVQASSGQALPEPKPVEDRTDEEIIAAGGTVEFVDGFAPVTMNAAKEFDEDDKPLANRLAELAGNNHKTDDAHDTKDVATAERMTEAFVNHVGELANHQDGRKITADHMAKATVPNGKPKRKRR